LSIGGTTAAQPAALAWAPLTRRLPWATAIPPWSAALWTPYSPSRRLPGRTSAIMR
jgi:hypothetical protein